MVQRVRAVRRRGVRFERGVDGRVSVDGFGCVRLDQRVRGGRRGCVRLDQRFLGDDRVETVVRVRGVVDGALGAVRVDQAVRAVHHVTVPALVLALRVAGQLVVHVVPVRVRRVRIVVRVVRLRRHRVVDVRGRRRVQRVRVRRRRVDGRSGDQGCAARY